MSNFLDIYIVETLSLLAGSLSSKEEKSSSLEPGSEGLVDDFGTDARFSETLGSLLVLTGENEHDEIVLACDPANHAIRQIDMKIGLSFTDFIR